VVDVVSTLGGQGAESAGTGIVLTSNGEVLTNNHVIDGATAIRVTDVGNGQTYPAKVVGYDVTGDIALIQLQHASGLTTAPLGNSATVKTGDPVVGMGNAEGQNAIVPVTGQVTALNQTITAGDQAGSVTQETLHHMIQTNANIVSGDSGGPLANSAGQVIGMDTAGNDGGFGVQQDSSGYAIPIDTALAVEQQIVQGQASSTVTIGYPPFMGVYIGQGSNSDPQAQAQLQNGGNGFGGNGFGGFGGNGNGNQNCYTSDQNLVAPANIANVNSGTLILGTICGGPAMAAGMTAGSVITAVNGQAIGSPDSLTGVVSKFKPGTTINVTWVSPSGHRSTSSIKLSAGPPQ